MTTEATAIRDAIYNRLSARPGYVTIRKTQVPQIQPDQLPALSIYILSERLTPHGDDNVGELRFFSETTVAVSVVRGFDDNSVLSGLIDVDVDAIENALLTDPSFVNFGQGSLFEAVPGIARRRIYSQTGETYFAELRLEISFRTYVEFNPVVPDDLTSIDVETRPITRSTTNPNDPAVVPVHTRYTLPGAS